MKPVIGCVALALAVWGNGALHAAGPSAPTPQIRYLSLCEAVANALENLSIDAKPIRFHNEWPADDLASFDADPSKHSARLGVYSGGEALGEDRPLLLLHIQSDVDPLEIKRRVHQLLINVECSYWNLYGTYMKLLACEQGLHLVRETYLATLERRKMGMGTDVDVGQCRGQCEGFRTQRLQALDELKEQEHQLHVLLGMPAKDGTRLMPSDQPTRRIFWPDWRTTLEEALANRPEMLLAVQLQAAAKPGYEAQRRARQMMGLPDLSPFQYSIGFRNIPSRTWPDDDVRYIWFDSFEAITDTELKIQSSLARSYRQLSLTMKQIQTNKAQREAFAEKLRRQEDSQKGQARVALILETQGFWVNAAIDEYQAVVNYNKARCCFEYYRGASMRYHNITVSKPKPAGDRAVQVERERSRLDSDDRGPALPAMFNTRPPGVR